jgi:hypothetical protein
MLVYLLKEGRFVFGVSVFVVIWFWNIALIKISQTVLNCLQIKSIQCGRTCASLSKVLSNVYMLKSKFKVIFMRFRGICRSLSQ